MPPTKKIKIRLRINPEAATPPSRIEAATLVSPSTPNQLDSPIEHPTTPTKQMIIPKTPMAPKKPRKRKRSDVDAEEDITLDTSPSRLLDILTATQMFETAALKPRRPQSSLKKQGIAAFTTGSQTDSKNNQTIIQQNESDPCIFSRLKSLVDRGRRAGGSPSYTFKRGRSAVRYDYMLSQDEERDERDENPRKKRREGSPLSKHDTKSMRQMFCKLALILRLLRLT
jgi:hypothetical protein